MLRRRPVVRPLLESLESRALLTNIGQPDIVMLAATTHDSQSVSFTYRIVGLALSGPLEVAISRGATPSPSPANIPLADVMLTGSDVDPGVHTITASIPGGLPIDPSHEFVIAQANPNQTIREFDSPNDVNDVAFFRTLVIGAVAHGLEISPGVPGWETDLARGLQRDGYNAVIPFDWSSTSSLPIPGATQGAGARLAGQIISVLEQLPIGSNDVVDLHLIGASRGAVVISQAALDLQQIEKYFGPWQAIAQGFTKMTFLDPHPANNVHTFGPPNQLYFSSSPGPIGLLATFNYLTFQSITRDPEVIVPSNVADSEVYYQHATYQNATDVFEKFFNTWGEVPIQGNVTHYCDLTGIVNGHFLVPTWYVQNVVPTLRTNSAFVCPGNMIPPAPGQIGTPGPFIIPTSIPVSALIAEAQTLHPAVVNSGTVALNIVAQLAAAEKSLAQGHVNLGIRQLQSFQVYVMSQRGIHIVPQAADLLIAQVQEALLFLRLGGTAGLF
jgi:hypothetical protein